MKLLLSINNKFYKNYDYTWINLFYSYDVHNIIDGCEFYVSFNDKTENKYILDLVSNHLYNPKWYFQFHAPNLTTYAQVYSSYLPLLQYYDQISQIVGYKIKVNFHPIESNISINDSIVKTAKELYKIVDMIQKKNINIDILIENLNIIPNIFRPNLEDLGDILTIKDIGFTYDIGHMTVDNKFEYGLNKDHINKIKNIHLHDTQDVEHFPFYNNKLFLEDFFQYIKSIEYDNTIVAEIALDYMSSKSLHQKILEYTRNMYMLSYYYNSINKNT